MRKSTQRYAPNMGIQRKIMVPFVLLITGILLVISTFSFILSEQIIRKKVGESTIKTLEQAKRHIESKLKTIQHVTYLYCYDNRIRDSLVSVPVNQQAYLKESANVDALFQYVQLPFADTELFVTLHGFSGKTFVSYLTAGTIEPAVADRLSELQDWAKIITNPTKDHWLSTHRNMQSLPFAEDKYVISLAKGIVDPLSMQSVGICLVSISEREIATIFDDMELNKESSIMLLDKTGVILSHSDRSALFDAVPSELFFNSVANEQSGYFQSMVAGKKCMVIFDTVEPTGWKIVEIVPEKLLLMELDEIRWGYWGIGLSAVLIAFVLSYLISSRITRPIKVLTSTMQEIGRGDLQQEVVIQSGDEIEMLGHHFNEMIHHIRQLIQRVYEEQEEKRRLLLEKKQEELELLQAQINPHFLFNTLNAIKWMAVISQANHVADMISALGGLLEMSFNAKAERITMAEEFDNIKNYIALMQMRYNNDLHVEYELDCTVAICMIPKLILQPIVENAILHGFEGMDSDNCIRITCHPKGVDELTLCVEDNGIGIPEEKLANIFQAHHPSNRRFSGIGLNNVQDRILIQYGEKYRIKVSSQVGQGTTVTINLPIHKLLQEDSHV